MKKYVAKLAIYGAFGIVAVPFSIISHELGHLIAYWVFGATDIQLHSVSVSANKESLSNVQIAVAIILGPAITYATILAAYFVVSRKYHAFWIILALAAPLGRIVNFVYVYFRALGYNPNPNFDEYNFARAVNTDPLFVAIPTLFLVLGTFIYFFRKGWREDGITEVFALATGVVAGVAVWFVVGPIFLP